MHHDDAIYRKPKGITTRWINAENPQGEKGVAATANSGRKGAPCRPRLAPGESHVLAEMHGPGVVRHIWITFETREQPEMLKSLRLECFWDHAQKPAVSVPLGDFFCFNTARLSPMQNAFFSNPEGRSFNCYIPMPFRSAMRIVLTNDSKTITEGQLFYQVDCTLGDPFTDETLYFHAFYNRQPATRPMEDYTILPAIQGQGRYLGTSFGVIANPKMKGTWWGEGEVKCYIDGDQEHPTLAGTGTEDYIGTGWGQGVFVNLYQGCLESDDAAGRYASYRFHVPDPVYFDQDLRVTIQQIGCTGREGIATMLDNGLEVYQSAMAKKLDRQMEGAIFERFDDDWCSIAYLYLNAPQTSLPALPPVGERLERYAS